MSNFPSKWYDFINHKELKRLRHDLNNTLSLRIEIAVSIILAIISFFFGKNIVNESLSMQITICSVLCVVVALLFLLPYLLNWISVRRRCNVFISGKDAVSIFDDEIVYDILVASEYYNTIDQIPNTALREELRVFYAIEIKYYLEETIKKLTLFNSNLGKIFGNEKNKIPLERVNNVRRLIDKLFEKNSGIYIDKTLKTSYEMFCTSLESLNIK